MAKGYGIKVLGKPVWVSDPEFRTDVQNTIAGLDNKYGHKGNRLTAELIAEGLTGCTDGVPKDAMKVIERELRRYETDEDK